MKTVFNNDMVCHVWAQQSQNNGRNSNGSISFSGSMLKSYNMNIAKFISNSVVLLTSDGYSNTTAAHKSTARYALHSYVTVLTVPEIDIEQGTKHKYTKEQNKKNHKINLAFYKDKINSTVLKAGRARNNKDYLEKKALDLVIECNFYIDTFKLRNKHIELPNKDEILLNAKKLQVKQARAKIKKDKQILKDNQEKIGRWLDGDNVNLPRSIDIMLRLQGENIQSSHGSTFPIKHGYLALQVINKCKLEKSTFKKNGRSIKLGYFEIDTIDHYGNVKAGCHYVKYEQIARIEQGVYNYLGK